MEAFLNAAVNSHLCDSVADLQAQLRQLLNTKVNETKAEHISTTFELPSSVVFSITIAESENAARESAANIDPQLGEVQTNPASHHGPQSVKQISARDTLVNQASNDPALQRTVAKHLVAALGEADQAHWTVRQVSQVAQGWTFTYVCKDSAQEWARQHAKHTGRITIGEWSTKDSQSLAHMARPAFDCRGAVTISFSKSHKAINLRYEHTPIHRTVAQLMDQLFPPPPPPVVDDTPTVRKPVKTPNSKRQAADASQQGAGEGSSRKKRKSASQAGPAGDGASQSTPQRKKDGEVTTGADGAMLPPEMPGALPVGESSRRPLYNTQLQLGTQNGAGIETPSSYPEGLVGTSNSPAESQASAAVATSNHVQAVLNLPAAEIERRRDVAIQLLNEHNVDPKTLSPEQFSIFSNQSPELQKESLAMLKEYGAERLRIVHPSKEGPAASGTSAAAGNQNGEWTPADASQAASGQAGESQDGTRPPLQGTRKTRGACDFCRRRKVKCGKEKPSCLRCIQSKTACSYPDLKSKKSDSAAFEGTEGAQGTQAEELDGLQSPGIPDDSTIIAVSGSESTPAGQPADYAEPSKGGHQDSLGRTLPPASAPDVSSQEAWPASSGVNYNHVHAQNSSAVASIAHQVPAASTGPPSPEPTHTTPAPAASEYQEVDSRHAHPGQQSAVNRNAWAGAYADMPSSQTHSYGTMSATAQMSSPEQSASQILGSLQTFGSQVSQQTREVAQQASELARATSNERSVRRSSHTPATSSTPTMAGPHNGPRHGTRPQSRTSVQAASTARKPQGQSPTPQEASVNSTSSNPARTTSPYGSLYGSYQRRANSHSDNETGVQTGDSMAYSSMHQPYGTVIPGSYSNYDTSFDLRSRNIPTSRSSINSGSQEAYTSYTTVTGSSANLLSNSSTSQARASMPYGNSSGRQDSQYASGGQQAPAAQRFNAPRRAPAQGISTNRNPYAQQQPQSQQQSAYPSYPSRPPSTTSQQQNWHGFSGSSGGQGSGTAGYSNNPTTHSGGGHYGQQDQSMGVSSHRYTNIDGSDQAICSLLWGNHGT